MNTTSPRTMIAAPATHIDNEFRPPEEPTDSMYSKGRSILYLPVIHHDSWTGEDKYRLLVSPPNTVVKKNGVPTPSELGLAIGKVTHRHYRVCNPDTPGFNSTSDLGQASIAAEGSIGPSTKATPIYPETDMARQLSIILPRGCKADYQEFASRDRGVSHRYLHPNKYRNYLRGKQVIADHLDPSDKLSDNETIEPPRPNQSHRDVNEYPLISQELQDTPDIEPSTFFSMRTEEQKPSRYRRAKRAVDRGLNKSVGSVCSRIKNRFVQSMKGLGRSITGQTVRGTVVKRKEGISAVGTWIDEAGGTITSSEVGAQPPTGEPSASPTLLTRFAERIHLSNTGTRLVKKRPGDTMNSRSSSIRVSNGLDKMDPIFKDTSPDRSSVSVYSRTSSLLHPPHPPHPPPPPPYSPYSVSPTTRSSTPPQVVVDVPVVRSPSSVGSWGGTTQIGSKAGSVSSAHAYGNPPLRGSPSSIIEQMNRQRTGTSVKSDISGTTAGSPTSLKDHKNSLEESERYRTRAGEEWRINYPKATLESDFWSRFRRVNEKGSLPGSSFKSYTRTHDTVDSPIPTLKGFVFPFEQERSLGIMA